MNISPAQWSAYLQGTIVTIELAVAAIIVGLLLGLVIALGRISRNKLINSIAAFYVWLFRGTPLLLQILIIYFQLAMIGIKIDAFPSAVIAFGLNSAAYMAEVIRAAILSIDKGQMEAAKALGMTYNQGMFKIVIPQAYKRLLPPIGNEFIMLLKESSLVSVIGITELLWTARKMTNSNGGNILYYLIATAIYLLLTTILSYLFKRLERRHSIYE